MKLFNAKLGWGLLLVLALAFPFMAGNDYHLTVMSTAYIYAIATIGLNLITGYTGQFNLAHSGFMAVGAYTVGILTVDYGVSFWLAFALSGVVAAILGFFVGIVSLRLKTHFFSIFTLCVGYIMYLVIEAPLASWASRPRRASARSTSPSRAPSTTWCCSSWSPACGSCTASSTRCWAAPSWRSATAMNWPRRLAST